MSSTPEAERARERSFGEGRTHPELTLGLFGPATGAYGEVAPADAEALVERAFELGVRSFDVAPAWGESESLLTRALGARVHEVRVSTRAGRRFEDGQLTARFDASSLRADLEGSLARLGRDQVDVVFLHAPSAETLRRPGEALDALRVFKSEGLVHTVGATATSLPQAQAALDAGAEALAMPLNLLGADEFDAIRAEIAKKKTAFFAASPLLHGLLADRLSTSHAFAETDHRSLRWTREGLRVRLRHVAALRFLIGTDQLPNMAVASIRFVLAQPEVTSVLLGPKTLEELEELVTNAGEAPYLSPEALGRLPQILAAVGA